MQSVAKNERLQDSLDLALARGVRSGQHTAGPAAQLRMACLAQLDPTSIASYTATAQQTGVVAFLFGFIRIAERHER